ncbi:ATP-grasp domain-containing protein [Micromonospora sp. NPDC049801]|uniref:ATP-grasp domain-containing protein n=1 Tax=unclassified Micromonospora TaxID=2617518 RepID=UPI0033E600EB
MSVPRQVQPQVLILSELNAGGVRYIVHALRERAYSPVLVSNEPDDLNRGLCDGHVLVDWAHDSESQLAAKVAALAPAPVALINLVEALIPWQIHLVEHFGVHGASPGLATLLSKAKVRSAMREHGLSDLRFTAGPAASFPLDDVPGFPVIGKPSQRSGASRSVRLLHDRAEATAFLLEAAHDFGADCEMILEEFVPGTEFSMDGPVTGSRFTPVVIFEKDAHVGQRFHDTGLLVSPPTSDGVDEAARRLADRVSQLCAAIGVDEAWFHVEGRAAGGVAELIEINPRVGGGVNLHAVTQLTGLNPIDTLIDMALFHPDERKPREPARQPHPVEAQLWGALPIQADEAGIVTCHSAVADLLGLPGVVDGLVLSPYRAESIDQENFFAHFLLAAPDVATLRARAAAVRDALVYTVSPLPEHTAAG